MIEEHGRERRLVDVMSRRSLGKGAVVAGAIAVGATPAPRIAYAEATPTVASDSRTKIVLVGTGGGPTPLPGPRVGVCTAIVVGKNAYLIDLGQDCLTNIPRSGIPFSTIQGVFISHLHSDHIAELYNLIWLNLDPVNGIGHPLDIWGPGSAGALPANSDPATPEADVPVVNPENPAPGLIDYFAKSIEATAYDANLRIRDEGFPDIRTMILPHEIVIPDVGASQTGDLAPPMDPFPIVENDDIAVTATLVRHTPVFPSFAFRFETPDGVIAHSCDTTVTENLVTLAQGADILIHEVVDIDWMRARGGSERFLEHVAQSHTDVNQVGAVAEACGVQTLILTHLIPSGDQIPDESWKEKAQQGFSGEVIVGRDVTTIPVGG